MTVYIFYFLIALMPISWIVSLYIIRKWQYVLGYFIMSSLVVVIYSYVILFSTIKIFSQDELGLKKIFLFLYTIMIHSIAGFIFALIYKYKFANKQKPTL
jgi:hypothetical protein